MSWRISVAWSASTLVDEGGARRRLLKAFCAPSDGTPLPRPRSFVLADESGSVLDTEPAPPAMPAAGWRFGFWVPESALGARELELRIEAEGGATRLRVRPGEPGPGDRYPLRLDRTGDVLQRHLEERERVPPASALDPFAPSPECLLDRHAVVYQRPASHWTDGLPLGNGRLGGLVTGERGAGQRVYLDACSLWAASPEGRPLGRVYAAVVDLRYRVEGGYAQRLDLFRACVETADGPLRSSARVCAERDLLELDLEWRGEESVELAVEISRPAVPLAEGQNSLLSRVNGSWQAVSSAEDAGRARDLWHSAPCSEVRAGTDLGAAWIRHRLPNIEYAVAARLEGGRWAWSASSEERRAEARAVLRLEPGEHVLLQVGLGVAGPGQDLHPPALGGDVVSSALDLVGGRIGGEDAHREWWRRFWDRSSVELPDPLMENLWYLGVYHQACFSRSLTAPGFLGLWHPLDYRTWDDAYVADAQIELMWWAPFASGHLELLLPSHNTLARLLVEFLEHNGEPGALVPHVFFPAWAGGHATFGARNPYKGSVAWSALTFWWDYLHTGDRDLLADLGYPYIAACADYHAADLERGGDGLLHCRGSGSPEQSNTAEDNSYDRACIESVLRAACAAADVLGGEEQRSARWHECLARLYPFPTDGTSILECPDNQHPYRCHPTVLFGVHPTGCIEPGDRLWGAAGATYDIVTNLFGFHYEDRHEPIPGHAGGVEPNGHATAFLMHAAARLKGWPEVRRLFEALAVRTQLKRNGLRSICDPRHSAELSTMAITEATSGQTSGIREALVQDYRDHVRIFPFLTDGQSQGSYRFAGLRARGGFVLAGALGGGMATGITVHSLRGGVFRASSPWPGSVPEAGAHGLRAISLADGAEGLELDTFASATYRICRDGDGRIRCRSVELCDTSPRVPPVRSAPRQEPRAAHPGDWDDYDPPVLYYPEDPPAGQSGGGGTAFLGMPTCEPADQSDEPLVRRAFGLCASQDWRARATAARWLARSREARATTALERLATDPVAVVAYTAGVSLVRQGTPRALAAAAALLSKTDLPHRAREIRKAAARRGIRLP